MEQFLGLVCHAPHRDGCPGGGDFVRVPRCRRPFPRLEGIGGLPHKTREGELQPCKVSDAHLQPPLCYYETPAAACMYLPGAGTPASSTAPSTTGADLAEVDSQARWRKGYVDRTGPNLPSSPRPPESTLSGAVRRAALIVPPVERACWAAEGPGVGGEAPGGRRHRWPLRHRHTPPCAVPVLVCLQECLTLSTDRQRGRASVSSGCAVAAGPTAAPDE